MTDARKPLFRKECHHHKKVTILKNILFCVDETFENVIKRFYVFMFPRNIFEKIKVFTEHLCIHQQIYDIYAPDDPPSRRAMANLF